jgi:type II secretory pathway pseudopilin PulG
MQLAMHNGVKMKNAFMLVEVMISIIMAGVLAAVLATMGYYTMMQGNTLKYQNTKTILEVIRSRLVNSATDPDSDSYFELLKEVNSTIPVVIGLGKDAWGRNINYTTYDFGITNNLNHLYADTNTSISLNTNVLGRLISLGEDGILQTTSNDTTAKGDDLMIEIGIGETNHLKLYGGSELTTQTRGYNSAVVSTIAPLTPINGTIWFNRDTNITQVYDANTSSWVRVF